MLILILPSFFIFSFFSLLSLLYYIYLLFSFNFSAATRVRILKLGTKLDSDELYCVTKEQPHIAYQSFYLFIFSFSPMEISVTDFSAPIGASVFKF